MRIVYAAVLLVFLIAILAFSLQNLETVSVAFLGWKASLPLPLLILLVYLVGMVSGGGLLTFLRLSLKRATKSKE